MASTVFIPGEGASKAGDVRTMERFTDFPRSLLTRNDSTRFKEIFAMAFHAIGKLQAPKDKSRVAPSNLDTKPSAYEMRGLTRKLLGYTIEAMQRFPIAVSALIVRTKEDTSLFSGQGRGVIRRPG